MKWGRKKTTGGLLTEPVLKKKKKNTPGEMKKKTVTKTKKENATREGDGEEERGVLTQDRTGAVQKKGQKPLVAGRRWGWKGGGKHKVGGPTNLHKKKK